MIYYFYGEDTFAAREAIGELVQQERANVRFLDGETLDQESLAQTLERGAGGLFGKEMVVMREPSQLAAALQEMVVAAADKETAAELVLWDSGEYDAQSAVYKRFGKTGRRFNSAAPKQLEIWMVAEAKKRGVTLAPRAAQLLIRRLGTDRWRLLSELERLSLGGEGITVAQVEREIPPAAEEGEIFEMLRSLTAGKRGEALRQLAALLESGASEFYIVSMLMYQFRTLYLVARRITQGISPQALRVLQEVAGRRPATAWMADLTRVVATDFAIKQGKTDPRTGVIMLVLGFAS